MYTGNEKVWPFKDIAKPAPRGHKVPVPGDTQGAAMVIALLLKRADALGVGRPLRDRRDQSDPRGRRGGRGRVETPWRDRCDPVPCGGALPPAVSS